MNRFEQRLIKAAREAQAIARGNADPKSYRVHVPASVDVRAIRAKTGLSQDEFADRYGIRVSTLRDWEQGRRKPTGAARILLLVINEVEGQLIVEKAIAPRTSHSVKDAQQAMTA